MEVAAIVAAAGSGSRFGAGRPKQFQSLGRIPILVRALLALEASPLVRTILTVVPEDHLDQARNLILKRWKLVKCLPPLPGGPTRQESVRIAFERLSQASIILIHDGARPFISEDLIESCVSAARDYGAALCAVRPPETVKLSHDGRLVDHTLNRSRIWMAQTPQAFRRSILADSYNRMKSDIEYTDEASLVEEAGYPVTIVPGHPENIKITTPRDMIFGRALLAVGLAGATRALPAPRKKVGARKRSR